MNRPSKIAISALALALLAGAASAQQAGSSTAPTADAQSPRQMAQSGVVRHAATDSTLAGGGVVALPGGEWDLGKPSHPRGGTVPGPGLLTGGRFTASSNYSHNARAWIEIFIRADGTCSVVTNALKSPGQNKTYSCGTWLPSGGSPGSYEVQFVAVNPVLVNENPLYFHPYYTATTGWLSLSTDQSAIADSSMVVGGGSPGSGAASVEVDFYVRIRAAGASSYVESGPFSLFAEAEAF